MPAKVDIRLITSNGLSHPAEEETTLLPFLRGQGLVVESSVWNDASVDWSDSRVCVVRSTWDYYSQREAFLVWARHTAEVSALWNPAPILVWNSHKSYLLHLEKEGIPVVPTILVKSGTSADLDLLVSEHEWPAVILKPAVSLGAIGVKVVHVGESGGHQRLHELLRSGDVLIQPFVESVKRTGEVSVVFVDGHAVHMVKKTPAAGDFRVQEQYGGTFTQIPMDDNLVTIAQRALDTVPEPLLYSRVDFVELSGKPHIMEIELIEPSLYLEVVPSSIALFAEAIISRLP